MSDKIITDDDLSLSATPDDSITDHKYSDQVKVGHVNGVTALKLLFAPENRKRLIAYAGVGLLLFVAIIYTFASVSEEEVKGGGGTVMGQKLYSSANKQPSQLQREEAQRYNNETLPERQASDPTAHPVILTEQENPFHEESELKKPNKLSEVGTTKEQTEPQQIQSSGNQGQQRGTQGANNELLDNLITDLLDAEGKNVPMANPVTWRYRKASNTSPASDNSFQGDDTAQVESKSKCDIKAARAGNMFMATADIALNSDVGGPVSLTIRNGKLRGAQLIGSFERKEEWLRLELNKLVSDDVTLDNIHAIGLDMETTLNAVQGDVDRHALYRYGWWGLGTALKAIGTAAQNNANSQFYMSNGTVVGNITSSTSREVKMALGSLGQDLGEVMKERINRPITVTLKVGDELGVFFLDDVCIPAAKNSY